jgi:hypothetical protein
VTAVPDTEPTVALEIETSTRLVSTGRMGEGIPDLAEVTFACPDCTHAETVMVDVVPTFAMLALHRGRDHQKQDAANRRAQLLDAGGRPITRAERRRLHRG